MIDAPVAFAFAAGLVATVNPCGFAMLPAYLSYFMGLEEGERSQERIGRGLLIGSVVSSGFLVAFGVVGALVTVGLRSVIDYVPWAALVIGIGLIILGIAMAFFGYEPRLALPKLDRGGSSRRYSSVFVFGVSYAVTSLSCALPVFLTVVGAASATPNFASGLVTFVVYGAGMSMLVVVLTIALSLAKGGIVRRMRSVFPYVTRISGAILVLVGAYIVAYWAANIRDPLAVRGSAFRISERPQAWITDHLGSRPEFWAIVFGVVLVVAVGAAVRSSRRQRRQHPPTRPRIPVDANVPS